MNLMSGRDICVCYLVEVLQISQPKISRHLARLRRAGLVAARREGKWMHYRVSPAENSLASRILEQLKPLFAEDAQMRHDRLRLSEASCSPRKFVRLKRAPVPTPVARRVARKRVSAGGMR